MDNYRHSKNLGNDLPVNTTPLRQRGSSIPWTLDNNDHGGRTRVPVIQTQQNIGDISLEEFLFQAGVGGSNNNGGYTHGLSSSLFNSNTSLDHDQFQLSDLMNEMVPRSHQYEDGSRSTYEPQQPIMSITDATQGGFSSGFMGIGDQTIDQNMTSLVPNVATIPSGPMAMTTASSGITASPISGRIQKRKGGHRMRGGMDDVDDKKQLRKIKNRESAARSQERKKAKEKETEKEREYWKKKCQDLEKEIELLKEMINRPERRLRRSKSDMK